MATPAQVMEDEDIAIYIDELKCDDPNLKLVAVTKIIPIAQVLGPARTREELVPYLTEIIEEYDNEDEFLIKLSEQIVLIKDYIGDKESVHLLLTPLEFIASIEEPKIREAAIKSIKGLVEGQSAEFYEEHFNQMVSRLVLWENYTSKISGAALIPLCFTKLSQEKKSGLRSLVKDLSKDDIPMVRRAVAQILIELADNVYSKEQFDEDIKEMIYTFLMDPIESVKLKTLEYLPELSKHIEAEEICSKVIDTILAMDKDNKNWRIRYHQLDTIVGIVHFVNANTIKTKLIPYYKKLIKDSEQEVRSNALENLGRFATTINQVSGSDEALKEITELLKGLLKDSSFHVRTTLVGLLSKNLDTFPPSFKDTEIPEIIMSMMKDENLKVKLSALHSLCDFVSLFTFESFKEKIIPIFEGLVKDTNWKVRSAVLSQNMDHLKKWAHNERLWPILVDLCLGLKDDHVFFIRTNLVDALLRMRCSNSEKIIKLRMQDLLEAWSTSKNFIYRVSSIKALAEISEQCEPEYAKTLLELVLNNLNEEKIYNVRLNAGRLLEKLSRQKSSILTKKAAEKAIKWIRDNNDFDLSDLSKQIIDNFV